MNEEKNNYKDVCSRCDQTKHRIRQTIERLIKPGRDVHIEMVAVRIKHKALHQLLEKIASRPAESGGILLGPVGTNYITDFYFDHSGTCTGGSYSPDHITINRKLHEYWQPAGLEIKGCAHSHPGNLDSLTYADMGYIKRLMVKNPDMKTFVAPIVLPHHYAIRPLVVSRDQMNRAQQAYFEIFD